MLFNRFFVLLGLCTQCVAPNSTPLVCDVTITDFEVVFSDTIGVDLSRASNMIKHSDRWFVSHWVGGVVEVAQDGESITQIGRQGRGPFEFSGPVSMVRHDTRLFLFDIQAAKVLVYDLVSDEFEREFILPSLAYGPILLARSENDRLVFYFLPQRRDRRLSNDTFVDLIRFDTVEERFDTLASTVDRHMLNYWNESQKADYAFYVQSYINRLYVVIRDSIYYADSDRFALNSIEGDGSSLLQRTFDYTPNYEPYMNTVRGNIRSWSMEAADHQIATMNQAIRESTRPMDAVYSSVIANNSMVLFSLFTNTRSYLLFDLDRELHMVICASDSLVPKLIDSDAIYWVIRLNGQSQQLVKTNIN